METKGSLITFKIDGKPLEKLIEVVSCGIGTLYNPRKIRKEADATAYAIKVLEKAKAEASSEAKIIAAETAERIGQRLAAKEVKRQNNIDDVVELAANELAGVEVSENPVEEDWTLRFFDIVQDVSKDEMKVLWAKILAKEIERPSSFSIRTLEILKNLSYEEAELFVKLTEFVFKQNDYFIFNDAEELERCGIKYLDLAKLREAGLLHTGELVQRTFKSDKSFNSDFTILYGNNVIFLTIPMNSQNVVMPVNILTQSGCELYDLTEHKENMKYVTNFAAFIKKKNPSSMVQYGEILEIKDEHIRFKTPLTML